ncbi:MAG: RimK family alpha-L-glutamate ligase [Sphingomonadaceae bacterium]
MKLEIVVTLRQDKDMTRLCILTPDPAYPERWTRDADLYRALFGDDLAFRPWIEPGDLSAFSLVMPLIVWGYPLQTARWFAALDAWEAAGLALANPVTTLRWNTNKDYLIDLAEQGLAIVPTQLSTSLDAADLDAAREAFGGGDIVIKPTISAGAYGTYRLGPNDPIPFDVIEREMLIQPMMPSIESEGEFSLFYFGGAFSHAILKKPAAGDFRVQEQFGGREGAVMAPPSARVLAEAAIAAAPGPLLYARVDMVRGSDGEFALMELELIEPSLFLHMAADSGQAFARAVSAKP